MCLKGENFNNLSGIPVIDFCPPPKKNGRPYFSEALGLKKSSLWLFFKMGQRGALVLYVTKGGEGCVLETLSFVATYTESPYSWGRLGELNFELIASF